MPNRQINLFVSLTAACLFCWGCGSDTTPEKQRATQESNLNSPSNPAESKLPKHDSTHQQAVEHPQDNSTNPTDVQPELTTDSAHSGQDENQSPPAASEQPQEEGEQEKQTIEISAPWVRLSKKHEIWIDMKSKKVMVAGQICLRQGGLEVFACPRRTKEHESIVSVNASALELHTCLIAIGADPGKPVQWTPEYKPATGPKINIDVVWSEDGQQITRNAKELVRNFDTKKELSKDWVFCGSQFYVNPEDGSKTYYGDSGEMICLSNFATATLDLPVESSGSNESLLFEANTEKAPPLGTKVYLVLSVLDKEPTK